MSNPHLETIVALRDRLIEAMESASPGVLPQYAKQIRDLSKEIDELTPKEKEATDIDSFRAAFRDDE
ncbi:hypothetical protein [Nocardia terpenica]|uniref:Uncharacterized protein n=1 Tax=Nocardia terpenica TaxID=455432 RepID=A0A6G9Z6W7_9NOCA|nr:hypothetical protein [Nocardia terpenica]QIS21268.1 hypothetical protein F6W96_26010 [Nocardia terpenica]